MCNRPLMIMIPEPRSNGQCNPDCVLYEYWPGDCGPDEWYCSAKCGRIKEYGMYPGPGCPQYKETNDE